MGRPMIRGAVDGLVDAFSIDVEGDGGSEGAAFSLDRHHRQLAAVQLHHLLAEREP